MTATINTLAAAYWSGADGTPVEVIETKPNGRAVKVKLLAEYEDYKEGKRVWMPTKWITETEPERCPECGLIMGVEA